MPGREFSPATLQRELWLAIGFFAVSRLLIVLIAVAILLVLAEVATDSVLVVAGAAVLVPGFIQVDRMLERAHRDLADTRRATRWAAARAEQSGGAAVCELLTGFHLFDRSWAWLTSPGRKLARERSLALLAATFGRHEEGRLGLAGLPKRYGWPANCSATDPSSLRRGPQPIQR
ncbi:MAG: hypothetical protein ABR592_09105 [Nitriliruptorales bacterium]